MKRTLRLAREPIADLTTEDLTGVVGALSGLTCPVLDCIRPITDNYSCPVCIEP